MLSRERSRLRTRSPDRPTPPAIGRAVKAFLRAVVGKMYLPCLFPSTDHATGDLAQANGGGGINGFFEDLELRDSGGAES